MSKKASTNWICSLTSLLLICPPRTSSSSLHFLSQLQFVALSLFLLNYLTLSLHLLENHSMFECSAAQSGAGPKLIAQHSNFGDNETMFFLWRPSFRQTRLYFGSVHSKICAFGGAKMFLVFAASTCRLTIPKVETASLKKRSTVPQCLEHVEARDHLKITHSGAQSIKTPAL